MKNILKFLTLIFVVTITNCKKEDSAIESDTFVPISNTNFIFSVNEKNEFENELALKIESENSESLKIYKTENSIGNKFEKIIFSDNNTNDFIIESNITSDTLYIYQRDLNRNKTKEGLRYLKLSETEHRLDFVVINDDKSVTTLNQYTLTTRSVPPFVKLASLRRKSSTDIDDLENEITETGEFLADPTNTHPITAFYKGIVKGLFDDDDVDENDVFDEPSKSVLSSILDGLDSKRKNILRNLGKISDFIKDSKNSIKDFTKEQIDEIIKKIEDEELIDEDNIDDDFLKDCKGVIDGPAVVDMCEECVKSILETCEKDCNGEWGGSAYLDNCNECVGGNTKKEECIQDCKGDFGGTAYLDDCDDCVGGNTGKTECIIGENNFIGNWTAISFNGGTSMGELQKSGFISECNIYTEQWTINSASANITQSNISVNISQKTGSSGYESSGGKVDCESISIEFDIENFTINDNYTVRNDGSSAVLNTELDCEGEGNNISRLTISGNRLIFKYCELTLTFEK